MTTTDTHPPSSAISKAPAAADPTRLRRNSILLLIGAILIPIAGQFHPVSDPDLAWDNAIAGMLEDGAWYPAHLVEFTGLVLVAYALWQIARTPLVRSLRTLRFAVMAVAAGTTIHVVDMVPHTFAASQADAIRAGDGSPLFDAHLLLQGLATPVLGVSVAVLAVLDARRSRRWTWVPAAVAVVGGLVGAVSGPALLITEDASYAALFVGYAGLGVWLLVTAIRRLVALRNSDAAEIALT